MTWGDGAIIREKNGRYRGYRNVDGKRIYRRGSTRSEVRGKLRQAEMELLAGSAEPRTKMTVGELLNEWLVEASPNRARVNSTNTLDAHRWAVEKHLIPNLGVVRLNELDREQVEQAFKKLAMGGPKASSTNGLSRDSLVKLRATLHMAIDWAVRRQWIRWNAAAGVEIPRTARERTERRSMKRDEVKRFVAACRQDEDYGAIWITMLAAALRPGEATGLARSDLDLENRVLRVSHSLARMTVDGKQRLRRGPVKTNSDRAIELPRSAVDMLQEHLARVDERRTLAAGEWADIDWEPVFVTTWGSPIDPSNLRRALRTTAKAAGLEGRWTPYELRHTSISLLSDAGVDKRLIADLAGHRTTRMIDETYRHALNDVHGASVSMEKFL